METVEEITKSKSFDMNKRSKKTSEMDQIEEITKNESNTNKNNEVKMKNSINKSINNRRTSILETVEEITKFKSIQDMKTNKMKQLEEMKNDEPDLTKKIM